MKTKLSLTLVIVVIVAAIVSVLVAHYDELLPHRWETYTAPDRTFSIELPAKPSVETTQVPLDGGGTAIAQIIIAQPTKDTAFSCVYSEHENPEGMTTDQVLEAARDGSLRKIQGTVLTQKKIIVQGHPGLEMQARARGDSLVDARLLVVGNRLYMIMAVAPEHAREAKTVQRVLESFKLNIM